MGLLACALAALTAHQARVWTSDEALWTQAALVAPRKPGPWINLAWARWQAQDARGTERYLAHAWPLLAQQPPAERRWARDQIDVAMAQLLMARGQLHSAAWLMVGAAPATELSLMCPRFRRVCALAFSPP